MEWIMIFFGVIGICCMNSIINEIKKLNGSQEISNELSAKILKRLPSLSWFSDNLKI